MREEHLVVRPFEDLKVFEFTSVKQVNEHASAEMMGMVPFEQRERYENLGRKEIWVQVMAISGEKEKSIFYGLTKQLKVKVKNQTCTVSFTLVSGTWLMDFEEHIRCFQSDEYLYKELLDVCGEEYEDFAKIMTTGKDKHIPHFLMQYQETDWSFIKRLASMNETSIFANCSTKGEKYHFGIPEIKSETEEVMEYQTWWDMEDYWSKKKYGLSIRPEDSISYIWESREVHELGENRVIDGKSLYIWKVESCLKGSELYHTCYMKSRAGFHVPEQKNIFLSGVSLTGKVKNVSGENVMVAIKCDEYKNKKRLCWFSFSTIYSSDDGTGWYCMPEIGDIVRLYFPTEREQDAYVASAYHEEGEDLRTQPECKFWRNKEGKEIQLSPERILLTNNDGTYIELSDEKGIAMVSQGSISMCAEGSLRLSSGSSIELSAPNDVTLRQGNTKLNLSGDITMQGAKVML